MLSYRLGTVNDFHWEFPIFVQVIYDNIKCKYGAIFKDRHTALTKVL